VHAFSTPPVGRRVTRVRIGTNAACVESTQAAVDATSPRPLVEKRHRAGTVSAQVARHDRDCALRRGVRSEARPRSSAAAARRARGRDLPSARARGRGARARSSHVRNGPPPRRGRAEAPRRTGRHPRGRCAARFHTVGTADPGGHCVGVPTPGPTSVTPAVAPDSPGKRPSTVGSACVESTQALFRRRGCGAGRVAALSCRGRRKRVARGLGRARVGSRERARLTPVATP
jgi:hypothetical protein